MLGATAQPLWLKLAELNFVCCFQCDKPAAQDLIVVSNDLRCFETLSIPGAVCVLKQGYVIAQTIGTTTSGVNTILSLDASHN
jgi:hypothetical protein